MRNSQLSEGLPGHHTRPDHPHSHPLLRLQRSAAYSRIKLDKARSLSSPQSACILFRVVRSSSMTLTEAKTRHAQLLEEIPRHDHAYYVLAQPTISDQEYDRLYHNLLDLETRFPELVTPDSPTQRVGGQPLKEFKPVRHLKPMTSLDNTYSQEELREFVLRVQRLLPNETLDWVVEPKIDGVAINLRYEQGIFTCGATRG